LLALTSAGVGSWLRTGDLIESTEVRELIGLGDSAGRVMVVVNAGYEDTSRPLPPRAHPDPAPCTQWFTSAP
jgi:hypothetical protein